jgi:uncharacterized membrane protein
MEASVESRLSALEERLATVESLLRVGAPTPRAPAMPRPYPPPRQPRLAREPLDLEELLGGRVLGWVGGIAVVLAAVFFLVMAVHNGWIDESTRVVLAFAGSALLSAGGIWLYERKGKTQAARAAVAAGIAAFYLSITAATALYHLVSPAGGLIVAGLIASAATALAIRWDSRELAGIAIVGALLAPALVDAGESTSSLLFMTLALCAAVGVLIWRRWSWLGVLAYVISAPQAALWLDNERHERLGTALVVTGVFWLLYVVAALGYELRVPTTKLRVSSASLLFMNASLTTLGGWAMLHATGNHEGATAWVIAVAVAHAVLGFTTLRARMSREVGALLIGVGSAIAAVGLALALDGPALVAGWAAESVLIGWVARRSGDGRGYIGSAAFLTAAAVHAMVFEAPPKALAYGLDSVPQAVVALVLVIAACAALAWIVGPDEEVFEQPMLVLAAAVFALYLGSVLVVELAGGHPGSVQQHAQLALSAFWAVLGFAALVAGLMRDLKTLRLGGLALLGLAVGKVFIVDLAALQSAYRVVSFLALGLLLLAGAFAYQRMRKVEP